MNYQIKTASFKDIQLMVDWAAMEKWNPGLEDAKIFQLIDLNGFFMGYLDDEPVSSISLVKYDSHFSFLGFYIVKPEYRGEGLGYQIWQHAMQYAGQSNIGLDGVVAQQPNYKQSGFKLAHKNVRYQLTLKSSFNSAQKNIISAETLPLNLIAQYDRACFPCSRDAFLASWLLMSNAISLVYFDGTIKGYGVIRKCREGYKIGPLFADNPDIALTLFQALANSTQAENQNIYLDIPEVNQAAVAMVQDLKMQPVFETARMYTQSAPPLALDKIFGMTAFEVG